MLSHTKGVYIKRQMKEARRAKGKQLLCLLELSLSKLSSPINSALTFKKSVLLTSLQASRVTATTNINAATHLGFSFRSGFPEQ